jgi:hypothetical protein
MSEGQGLVSVLYRNSDPLRGPLWLHRTTHQGALTRHPSRFSVAEPLPNEEHATKNVLPVHGFLYRTRPFSWERADADELSLSGEPECLSLQAKNSTSVRQMQDDGAKRHGTERRRRFLPMCERKRLRAAILLIMPRSTTRSPF